MKINFIINDLSVKGGTHKQLLRLCQYTDKQGIDFEIVTKSYDKNLCYADFEEFSEKIRVFTTSKNSKFSNFKNQFQIAKYLQKDAAEIINIHDNGFQFVIVLLFLFRSKSKIFWQINDIHGSFRVGNTKYLTWKWHLFVSRSIIKLAAKIVTRITVNVTKNKQRVKQYLNREAVVLYCGIDEEWINLPLKQKRINLPSLELLSIGVFYPYRNYETLIRAVYKLNNLGYQAKLNIVGSTDFSPGYAKKITQLVKDLKLEETIIICGSVSENELEDLLAKSNIFLFINIDQSWGLAVFEAIANSLPVIVSSSVGATELLVSNQTAFIIDPMNDENIVKTIVELANNPEMLHTVVLNAKKAIAEMSWDKTYSSKLLELFRNEKN